MFKLLNMLQRVLEIYCATLKLYSDLKVNTILKVLANIGFKFRRNKTILRKSQNQK